MDRNGHPLILVVEDDALLMLAYEMALEDAGVRFVTAMTLEEGLAVATRSVDAAILDIRLDDEHRVFPIAYQLAEAGVPFLFCSGTASDMPDGMFSEAKLLQKPIAAEVVVRAAIGLADKAEKKRSDAPDA